MHKRNKRATVLFRCIYKMFGRRVDVDIESIKVVLRSYHWGTPTFFFIVFTVSQWGLKHLNTVTFWYINIRLIRPRKSPMFSGFTHLPTPQTACDWVEAVRRTNHCARHIKCHTRSLEFCWPASGGPSRSGITGARGWKMRCLKH